MTSVRAGERLEQRPLRAVRSSNPYAKTGAPGQAERSLASRSATAARGGRGPRARAGRARRGRRRRARRGRRRGRAGSSSPDSSSPIAATSASANPPKRAERERPFSSARATAARPTSARCASVATRRAPGWPAASRRKRSSNVPIEPPRSAGAAARAGRARGLDVRPRSARSDRLVVEAGEVAVEQQLDLARVRRSREQRQPHLPIVVPGSDGSSVRAGRSPETAEEWTPGAGAPAPGVRCSRPGPPSGGDRAARPACRGWSPRSRRTDRRSSRRAGRP